MSQTHRILVGSLGDDIHTVGMALLKLALEDDGFFVRNIGIGHELDTFFNLADEFDAILLSCNNGHADLYLKEFPYKLAHFNLAESHDCLWYLGGHLSVNQSEHEIVRRYRKMGFDYVAPKPVTWQQVSIQLRTDFALRNIPARNAPRAQRYEPPPIDDLDQIDDAPMTEDEFERDRTRVLDSWPTGAAVHDTDVKQNHGDSKRNLDQVLQQHRHERGPLLQPRTGVAGLQEQIELLQHLQSNGLDVASIQLDAASRKNLYSKATEGLYNSQGGNGSALNGFPVPVHGVAGVQDIVSKIERPFQIRAGSPDHRLTYEIALAGGASSLEGGFLCYLLPYDRTTSPATCLRYWKYVDYLVGMYYRKHKIVIDREYFGPLTTSLIAPALPIVINVIQAILTAKAGGRCISIGLAEQGNRTQDIAAQIVLGRVTRGILHQLGYPDVSVNTVYHQYMAAFPHELERARELIVQSAVTAVLGGASRMLVKSPVEAHKIPNAQENSEALALARDGVKLGQSLRPETRRIEEEINVLQAEVTALLNAIEELGQGSYARGAIRALQIGWLDVPFSPSVFNRGELNTIRDKDGAIRWLDPTNMPFPDWVKDFHRERVAARQVLERKTRVSELIEQDLNRIWRCDYRKWPLDGHYVA